MKLKKIFLLSILIASFGATPICAQTRKKAKTHQVHRVKKTSAEDGDYYNGHQVYTGPRGGRYYINKNGEKTYI